MSLADVRDLVVIVYGVMGIVLMLALTIAAFGLWFAVRTLTRVVRDLLEDPVRPTLMEVRETVHNIAKEQSRSIPNMRIGIHAWAMVMYNGHYTVPHNHSDAHWACVYYADAGDADQEGAPASGLLALVDPRQGGRTTPGLDYVGTTFTVVPKTGRLVVFPAWLLHYVHTYLGTRPRISIACNLVLEPAAPIATNRQVQGVT